MFFYTKTPQQAVQGGSDISGTLSKLHHCIKKSYFSLIFSRQNVSAGCPIIDKNKQILSGKDESSLGRYVFGSEISYNKAPPRLPGLAY
jgi:hypothetical protein